jgi:uncharacterized protein YneR
VNQKKIKRRNNNSKFITVRDYMKIYVLSFCALFGILTAQSQTNVALHRPVIVDSDYRSPLNTSQFAVDGNKNSSDNETRWVSASGYPHFFEVNLDQAYSIYQVSFYTGYNGYNNPINDYEIQYWNGAGWQNAFIKTGNTLPVVTNTFPVIETDRIRLYATKGSDAIMRLYEFEVYGVPVDGGTGTGTGTGSSASYWKTAGETLLTEAVTITASAEAINPNLNINNLNQVNILGKESISLSSQSGTSNPVKLEVSSTSGVTMSSSGAVTTSMSTTGLWDFHDHDITNIQTLQAATLAIGDSPVPEGYSLAVDGQAILEGVKISLVESWPDYVFEDDYHLKSLEEVYAYIKIHKHLPEVPAAAEVVKNGLSLAEINAVLLKKVEELTLYLIEQDERIKKLEEKNATLEAKE